MKTMRNIKLITFDATNTFLKFRIPPWTHYASIARKYGFHGKEEVLKKNMLEGFKTLGKSHPNFGKNTIKWQEWWCELIKLTFQNQLPKEANVSELANTLIDNFKTDKCWCLANGSIKLIETIKKRGYNLGVISNFDPRLYEILKNLNIYNSFDFIAISYDIGYAKPNKKIFDKAISMSNLQLRPDECLHIGDDIKKDYEGARSAGWNSIIISGALKTDQVSSNHVFKDLIDVSKVFNE